MLKTYRKKPVTVEAIQYLDNNIDEIKRVLPSCVIVNLPKLHDVEVYAIKTLEGLMCISEGDWVIRGVYNECYPCKPDVFETTYDEEES